MFLYTRSKKWLVGAAFIILFIVITLFYPKTGPLTQKTDSVEPFNAEKILSKLNKNDGINDFLEIENMISTAMKKYGTKAGFEIIDEGERQGIVSSDECHGLLHYVGHAAYAEHPNDYNALLSVVEGTNCIGGYLHGIEAEIVLRSPDIVTDVQNFCSFQKERHVNPGACYHGVGHAATELYKYDIPKSLSLCDALLGKPEQDLSNCYRGVFSEVGNIVTGYDGHTGLLIDTIPIKGLDVSKPYVWCESFAQKYQSSCKSQLTKVATMHLDIENWLQACKSPNLDESTVNICLNIITGVYVRQHLSFSDTTSLPKGIYSFSEAQQQIAILGSAEAFSGYATDGKQKDWKSFCESITYTPTKQYCTKIFTTMSKDKTAPWMDRTDIR